MDLNNKLELGKYLESDMIELTKDEVDGSGITAVITVITAYISYQTCPTTACTRAC